MIKNFSITMAVVFGLVLVACIITMFSHSPAFAEEIGPTEGENTSLDTPHIKSASSAVIPDNALVHLVIGDPSNLDPAVAYATPDSAVLMQVYEPLIELKREQTDEFVPLLATDWTISPDGRTYTFHIRSGVTFHNGNSLSASDIAYTFQRGILQGWSRSPQSLLTEPVFGVGVYDVCDLLDSSVCDDRDALLAYWTTHASEVLDVCTNLTGKIVADNANATVTFHLQQAWSPFLNTLAGAWGSIIDQDWAIQQGAWDGNCNTWQNYYAPGNDTPLRYVTNGTGPFKLNHWTPNVEIVFDRNPTYWNSTPLWESGPFGLAAFETITKTLITTGSVRTQMLLNGEADLIDIDRNYATDLDNATLLHFTEPDGITPTLVYSNGVIKKYSGILSNSATDALFTHNIEPGGSINFVGSGQLDGNGIPADFFSDIHVRKGFNYAFDWDALNTNYFGGTAVQRTGPIIKPLMGYNDTQSKYYHDANLALSEFTAAWGGEVIDHGFTMTIAYNSGNSYRQMVADNIKTNIEALDPNFHINVINLDWNIYLQEAHAKHLPIYIVGWMGDIPHPHNWVNVHLVGAYAADTAVPSALITKYQTLVNTCLAKVGDDARICYEGIQNETYMDAMGIYLLQGTDVTWINSRIHGYYLNSAQSVRRYYDLYKTKPPVSINVDPLVEQSLIFTPTETISTMLTIPAGAVDDPIQMIAVPDIQVFNNQPEFILGKISFNLEAYTASGELIPNLTINHPITIRVNYDPASYTPDQESGLILYYWNNTSWEDAACGPYSRDLVNHILEVPICHLSTFAVGEPGHPLYIPLVLH